MQQVTRKGERRGSSEQWVVARSIARVTSSGELGKWFWHKSQDKVVNKCRLKVWGRRHKKQKSLKEYQFLHAHSCPSTHCRRVVFSPFFFSIWPNGWIKQRRKLSWFVCTLHLQRGGKVSYYPIFISLPPPSTHLPIGNSPHSSLPLFLCTSSTLYPNVV